MPNRPTLPLLLPATVDRISPLHSPRSPLDAREREERINRKYNELRSRSGLLTIMGTSHRCSADFLEQISVIGEGSFGVVLKARCKHKSTLLALKKILISNVENYKSAVTDLAVIMEAHACPNIVKCYGCFVTESEITICLELMAMGFDRILKRISMVPENIIRQVALSSVNALRYLKSLHMMHRDIKPANILIDLHGTIKLCDFGLCGRLIDTNRAETFSLGTSAYLPPERIGGQQKYGIRADVWSLGITLYELATGRNPYSEAVTHMAMEIMISREPSPRLNPSKTYSKIFCEFLNQCLQKRQEDRPHYSDLERTPFLTEARNDSRTNVESWLQFVIS
ncbi:unnamed protein product [Enterobius vermicularis]|uniref:mitogen-activated protein kinase kinase n=1 Tax=Enterobius vermicularis TaxID=51028 RepID=A0A0N4VQ62_ENTVE|nr:unnamed protein product [Enterobius vermicularis]